VAYKPTIHYELLALKLFVVEVFDYTFM